MSDNNPDDKKLEKWKLFYTLSSEVYNREEERYERFEEKSSKCLTAFTLLLAIYGFLWKYALTTLMPPPRTFLEEALSVFGVFLLLFFIFTWILTFRTFQKQGRKVMPLDEDMYEYFNKEKSPTELYKGLGEINKEAYEYNRKVTDNEADKFDLGYKMIWASVIFLMIFVIMYSTYLWSL